MVNPNVDQNGIPFRGFIKADRIRAQLNPERNQIPEMKPVGKPTENASLLELLNSSRATLIGAMTVLMLIVTVAYLLGENRGLSSTHGNTDARTEMVSTMPTEADAALTDELEEEKRKLTREIVQQEALEQEALQQEVAQQNTTQSTRQSLLRLKQVLTPQTGDIRLNTSTGEIDDYSLSLSDPLSGHVVDQVDPELEKLRLRVISMIDNQPETAIGNR